MTTRMSDYDLAQKRKTRHKRPSLVRTCLVASDRSLRRPVVGALDLVPRKRTSGRLLAGRPRLAFTGALRACWRLSPLVLPGDEEVSRAAKS